MSTNKRKIAHSKDKKKSKINAYFALNWDDAGIETILGQPFPPPTYTDPANYDFQDLANPGTINGAAHVLPAAVWISAAAFKTWVQGLIASVPGYAVSNNLVLVDDADDDNPEIAKRLTVNMLTTRWTELKLAAPFLKFVFKGMTVYYGDTEWQVLLA